MMNPADIFDLDDDDLERLHKAVITEEIIRSRRLADALASLSPQATTELAEKFSDALAELLLAHELHAAIHHESRIRTRAKATFN